MTSDGRHDQRQIYGPAAVATSRDDERSRRNEPQLRYQQERQQQHHDHSSAQTGSYNLHILRTTEEFTDEQREEIAKMVGGSTRIVPLAFGSTSASLDHSSLLSHQPFQPSVLYHPDNRRREESFDNHLKRKTGDSASDDGPRTYRDGRQKKTRKKTRAHRSSRDEVEETTDVEDRRRRRNDRRDRPYDRIDTERRPSPLLREDHPRPGRPASPPQPRHGSAFNVRRQSPDPPTRKPHHRTESPQTRQRDTDTETDRGRRAAVRTKAGSEGRYEQGGRTERRRGFRELGGDSDRDSGSDSNSISDSGSASSSDRNKRDRRELDRRKRRPADSSRNTDQPKRQRATSPTLQTNQGLRPQRIQMIRTRSSERQDRGTDLRFNIDLPVRPVRSDSPLPTVDDHAKRRHPGTFSAGLRSAYHSTSTAPVHRSGSAATPSDPSHPSMLPPPNLQGNDTTRHLGTEREGAVGEDTIEIPRNRHSMPSARSDSRAGGRLDDLDGNWGTESLRSIHSPGHVDLDAHDDYEPADTAKDPVKNHKAAAAQKVIDHPKAILLKGSKRCNTCISARKDKDCWAVPGKRARCAPCIRSGKACEFYESPAKAEKGRGKSKGATGKVRGRSDRNRARSSVDESDDDDEDNNEDDDDEDNGNENDDNGRRGNGDEDDKTDAADPSSREQIEDVVNQLSGCLATIGLLMEASSGEEGSNWMSKTILNKLTKELSESKDQLKKIGRKL